MAAGVDRHLDEMAERGAADQRNGSLADDEAGRDRAQHVRAYARPPAAHIDRMILACFVLGLAAIALLPILGRRIAPAR